MSEFYNIYLLKCPCKNIVRYVGITKNLDLRIKYHFANTKKQKKENCYKWNWISSLKRKKLLPSVIIVKSGLTKQQAEICEMQLISIFRSIVGKNLVNISLGGLLPPSQRGRKFSLETREKMRAANVGKTLTEQHKSKIKLTNQLNYHPTAKKVIQLTMSGEIVNSFCSIGEAARKLNLRVSDIVQVCKGNGKTTGGFRWKYCDGNSIC